MKSKCSFTLKALTALVLAVVMLFGTVATSLAAVVKDELTDTGGRIDLASTGKTFENNVKAYYVNSDSWTQVYLETYYSNNTRAWHQMTRVANTGIYYISFSSGHDCNWFKFVENNGYYDGSDQYSGWVNENYAFGKTGVSFKSPTKLNGTASVTTMVSRDNGANWTATANAGTYTSISGGNLSSGGTALTTTGEYAVGDTTTSSTATIYPAYGSSYTLTATEGSGRFVGYSTTETTSGAPTVTGNTDASKTKTSTQFNDSGSGDDTWYAYYKMPTVVTLNMQSGSDGSSSVNAFYGSPMPDATMPTRDGYTFGGYYSAADGGGTKYYNDDGTSANNWASSNTTETLYAYWIENKTTVSLSSTVGNDGTIYENSSASGDAAVGPYSVGVDTTQDLYADDGTDYVFLGWYVTGNAVISDGTDDYTNADYGDSSHVFASKHVIVKGSGTDGDSGTVFAYYIPAAVTVNMDAKVKSSSEGDYTVDGTAVSALAPGSGTQSYGVSISLNATCSDASVYHFVGWAEGATDDVVYEDNPHTGVTVTAAKNYHALFNKGGYVTFKDDDLTTIIKVSGEDSQWVWYGSGTNKATAPEDPTKTGYIFRGWSTDGTAGNIVNISSTNITSDRTFYAVYDIRTYTVTYRALGMDNATAGYNVAFTAPTAVESNGSGTDGTMDYGDSLALSNNNTNDAYEFVGWHIVNDANASDSATLAANTTFSDVSPLVLSSETANNCYHVYALYKKIYYLTLYNTYINENGAFVFEAAPPKKVTATAAGSNAVTTFKYVKSTTSAGQDATVTSGDFNEGNKLKVLAGDRIVMTYSSLAASDIIGAVLYRDAPKRYSTQEQDDNLYLDGVAQDLSVKVDGKYPSGDDTWDYTYTSDSCLYASGSYYTPAIAETIAAQTYAAVVDQTAHTVSFTADKDYRNVDIELASKKRVFFSDSDKITVKSTHVSNYYDIGEQLTNGGTYDTVLAVKAKGSADMINTITLDDIEVYYADKDGKPYGEALEWSDTALIAKGISAGESISSSGASDSSEYVYFYTTAPGAGMPSSDLYIDLKVTNSYNVYLDSKLQADEIEGKTKFCQVADVTVNTTGGEELVKQDWEHTGTTDATVVSAGGQVRLSYVWQGDPSWSNYYMFIGWYKGTADGPDFDNGFISTSNNISFKPEKNVYVYAVGTRDLYINGSSYITGSTYGNWNEISGTKTNYKMSFDPKKMVYYFTITESIFNATNPSHPEYTKGATGQDNTTKHYYWSDTNNMGNSFFIILDTATGMDSNNKQVWKSITSFDYTDSSSGVHFGKAYPNGYGGENWENKQKDGCAFIEFDPEDHAGYVAPLTIYFDPHASAGGAQNERLYVKATPIYGHIYASNGYTNVDSNSDTGNHDKQDTTGTFDAADAGIDVTVEPVYGGAVVDDAEDENYFDITLNGDGWNPHDSSTYDYEGHVNDYTVEKRNATVRITKTLSSATYKVSYFNVYNTATDKVKAYAATAGASNTYYVDLTMKDDQGLYVVPIIEYNDYHAAAGDGKPEAITILFDSGQLKSKEWGDFVACYAWYTDETTAYGEYPGQMMVPSDDGKSWSATFPSTKPGDSTKSLAGITFTNYYDSYRTWLGETNVYQGTQIITGNYNSIATRAGGVDYSNTNFKAQTYDYREPIAFFKNKTGDDELTIKFGIKSGGADLITWTHTDLVSNNILTYKTAHPSWSDIEFEYLYDSTGDNYCDLSGIPIEGEPAPSFYICAKGEAAYVDNSLARIFWSGKSYQTPDTSEGDSNTKGGYGTAVTYDDYKYYTANEINMSHAVQWYIYDASGNYITNILSAAFADKENTDEPMQTKVSKVLKDLGYPVDGRSVMIAYDMPRYCYSEEDEIPNTGSSFDAYRFAGQWYQKNDIDLINLNAEVGIINPDSSYTFANSDSAGYGSVTVSLNTAGFSHPQSNFANVTDKAAAFTTISDKDLRGVTFNASSTNFVGWYYKDSEGNMQEADYASATGFRPAYSDDTTYYAMYKASAFYRYNYAGRERSVSYTVSAGDMTADEMASGNKVATTRDDTLDVSYVPGRGVITRFKKTINFSGATTKTATDEYILDISGAVWTPETFTLTAYYPNAKNGDSVAHEFTGIAYNTAVDLTERASSAVTNNAPDTKVFKGWYDAPTGGNLISSQPNFGMVVVKATTIYAQYDTAPHSGTADWEVFIDENQVTHEMYNNENSGMYYNDTIVRVRQNNGSSVLPEGAEVGILVLNNGGVSSNLFASTTKLEQFANALPNGATGRVGSAGITVTKVVASKVTRFGRADLAVRGEYASTVGTTYRVYAYVKIGDTYHFTKNADTVIGTYAAFNA